jgi:hypothetical protein
MQPMHLWIDQHGRRVWARTVTELRQKAGGGRVSKMYVDMVAGPHAGKSCHVGYVVGARWLSRYAPVAVPA